MALYAEPADVLRGRRAQALQGVENTEILDALKKASSIADSYLAGQYKLPLKKWDDSLREHVANIAFYRLLSDIGFRPGSGEYELCRQEYEDAVAWFGRISRGNVHPPGMVDSTPSVEEYQVGVVTSDPRGW